MTQRNRYITLFVLLLVILTSNFQLWATSHLSAENCPDGRHYIFLIHGIGGDKKTFGVMEEILKRDLNPGQNICSDAISFEYQTGDLVKTPTNFALDFESFLVEHFQSESTLREQDKISLIMHSQGGIVGAIWLFSSFAKKSGYSRDFSKNIATYITLGTPFWGALSADMGKELVDNLRKMHYTAALPIGDMELNEMSRGSDTHYQFFQQFVSARNKGLFRRIKEQNVRFLNIGGVGIDGKINLNKKTPAKPQKKSKDSDNFSLLGFSNSWDNRWMKKFHLDVIKDTYNSTATTISNFMQNTFQLTGPLYENDFFVPQPSSRFDFIYAKSIKHNYTAEQENSIDFLQASDFIVTDFSEHRVVLAVHTNMPVFTKFAPPIAYIEEECLDTTTSIQCQDPTMNSIIKFLRDGSVSISNEMLSQRTTFELNLIVNLPPDGSIPKNRVKVKILARSFRGSTLNDNIFCKHGSLSPAKSDTDLPQARFHYTCSILHGGSYDAVWDTATFEDHTVLMKVYSAYGKQRMVEAKVRASYTTFAEINMEAN